jgi:hypothetical protein
MEKEQTDQSKKQYPRSKLFQRYEEQNQQTQQKKYPRSKLFQRYEEQMKADFSSFTLNAYWGDL